MPFSPVVALLQGIPECLVFVFLVYILIGAGIRPGRILTLGLLELGLLSAVRLAGAPFPAHTLFALIVMSTVISLWEKIPLRRVAVAWGGMMLVLILLETCFTMLATYFLGITLEEIAARPFLWVLTGWPHIIVMALPALWVKGRRGIKLFQGAAG